MVNGEKALNAQITFKKGVFELYETKRDDLVNMLAERTKARKNEHSTKLTLGKEKINSNLEENKKQKAENVKYLDKLVKKYGKQVLSKTELKNALSKNLSVAHEGSISM